MRKPSQLVSVLGVGVLLFLIATFSVVLRSGPLFANSLFDYEWHSATVLRHLQIWNETPVRVHHFVPAVTFDGVANKHINNHSSVQWGRPGYSDGEGNYYYVSYPPFAYYAPFIFFKVVGVEPNIVGLRLFNVLSQIATALVLFFLVSDLTKKKWLGILTYTLYIFAPISLYIHVVNYMSDMFVQLFFVTTVYLFYKILSNQSPYSKRQILYYVLFAVSLFLMVYTEWLGLFVAAVAGLIALFRFRDSTSRPIFWICFFVPLLALLTVVIQYASVSDLYSYIAIMKDRYVEGYPSEDGIQSPLMQASTVMQLYFNWIGPLYITVAVAVCALAVSRIFTKQFFVVSKNKSLILWTLALLFLPVCIHHTIFLNWSAFRAHYFSVLKSVPFLSVFFAVLVYSIWYFPYTTAVYRLGIRILVCVSIAVTLAVSILMYINTITAIGVNTATSYCEIGKKVKEMSSDDEVVFLQHLAEDRFNYIISPIFINCAGRNVQLYSNDEDARLLMVKNHMKRGIIFMTDITDGTTRLVDFRNISL